MPKTLILILLFFCWSFPVSIYGQDETRVSNDKYGFSINRPAHSMIAEGLTSVIEFAGDEDTYGAKARYLITSIRPFSMQFEDVESFLRRGRGAELFEKQVIGGLKPIFPDIRSINRSFTHLNDRPAIQGTFSFTAMNKAMKGGYLVLLIQEQSSFYSFTWSSEERFFNEWNKASEISAASLQIARPPKPGLREAD